MALHEDLKEIIRGEVLSDDETRTKYSRDASMFEVEPRVAVFPEDVEDVKALVRYVASHKRNMPELSLTARSGGTDMSGGALGESVVVVFTKYMNRIRDVGSGYAVAEPGVYYRDFERETLKYGYLLPSYPASREICAIGGMIGNNSGGEKTLEYGKTEDYVQELKVVLADGNEYAFHALNEKELGKKRQLKTFEGEIYRKIYGLIHKNYNLLRRAKPAVSKNSAGYYVWDVWNRDEKIFDLTKLFVGSQGTLGLVTEATFRLVPVKKHSQMVVIFLQDMNFLVDIVDAVLPLGPESFEAYDDHTMKLALKYFPAFLKFLGAKNILALGFQFLPEAWMVLSGGLPKLILQVEFTGSDSGELRKKAVALKERIAKFPVKVRILRSPEEAKKYWTIRRESFNLLRHRIKNKHTAPFIDDIVVPPGKLEEFLPRLNEILSRYPRLTYTVAGHVGDGNFHIIPLMDLGDPKDRDVIPELSQKVYDLVLEFGGSISGEHNDGLVRGPYLEKMYGKKVVDVFREIKKIFDPLDILNPGKKAEADLSYSLAHIRRF